MRRLHQVTPQHLQRVARREPNLLGRALVGPPRPGRRQDAARRPEPQVDQPQTVGQSKQALGPLGDEALKRRRRARPTAPALREALGYGVEHVGRRDRRGDHQRALLVDGPEPRRGRLAQEFLRDVRR